MRCRSRIPTRKSEALRRDAARSILNTALSVWLCIAAFTVLSWGASGGPSGEREQECARLRRPTDDVGFEISCPAAPPTTARSPNCPSTRRKDGPRALRATEGG
jgi:hypothetical protein